MAAALCINVVVRQMLILLLLTLTLSGNNNRLVVALVTLVVVAVTAPTLALPLPMLVKFMLLTAHLTLSWSAQPATRPAISQQNVISLAWIMCKSFPLNR